MRNDIQMQLIGDDHEQRSIATFEPPEINFRHSLRPIKTRRGCEFIVAGTLRVPSAKLGNTNSLGV